jgi:VWFA-related protein
MIEGIKMKLLIKRVWPALFFLCFVLLCLSFPSNQKQKKTQELRHEVAVTLKLVQVYVTDKKGNPVLDLKKEDFLISDNGKRKTITEFEKHILSLPSIQEKVPPEMAEETTIPAPRELMSRKFFLLFDFAYNNARGVLKAKNAALHFVDTQLQPSDEVGLLSYSTMKSLTLHEYLTTDHKNVREVVDSFGAKDVFGRAEQFEEEIWRQATGQNPLDASEAGGVGSVRNDRELEINMPTYSPEFKSFMDRQASSVHALQFVQKLVEFAKALRYIPGYKHIILFSSGIPYSLMYGIHQTPDVYNVGRDKWDRGNRLLQLDYEDMLKELAASNSTIYTLDTEDMGTMISVNSRLRGGYTLQTMASSTGGKYFGDINSFEKHLEKIQNLTACYYVLGYYVDEKWDGKYHKLKVKVDRPGCEVHAQKGYFNPKPFDKYNKLEKMLHLVDLALSEDPLFQTPVRFPLKAYPFEIKGKPNLALYTKMNRDKIQELAGEDVEIVSIIFDSTDNIVKIEREALDFLKIPSGKVYYSSLFPLDPGKYKCRIVLRNLETGRGAVASSSVKIPTSPSSGIHLYPLLLLSPDKDAYFLKKPSPAYSFDSSQYSPLIEELKQGTTGIFAVVRCSFYGISQPDIRLSANLIHYTKNTGNPITMTVSILDKNREDNTEVYFIELRTGELQSGEYFLYLFADDRNMDARSRVNATFQVR